MPESPSLLDAVSQAELVRLGKASPAELVDAAIARIERVDPQLNAVIHPLFEKARAAARAPELPDGPFRGVPILVKDLIAHSAGDPFCSGIGLLRRLGWRAESDTFLVRKLRAAGFVIVGRTNTSELGSVPTTEPTAFGPTRNPWDVARAPGGSSGGSAAAVASGMTPVAHGNDGGGSIRIPASMCGLVGLKPTRGRVSQGPDAGESWAGMTAELGLTRTVRDTAALLDVLSGAMPGDPYAAPPPARPFAAEVGAEPGRLRIGFMTRAPRRVAPVHPECAAAVRAAGVLLESLGHRLEESHPEALDHDDLFPHVSRILLACTARDLDTWSRVTGRAIGPDDVEPLNWAAAELGRRVSASEYVQAVDGIHGWSRRVAPWWSDRDLLLTPTACEPPPPLGEFGPAPGAPFRGWARSGPFVAFTQPFNVTGQPAISLPLHWSADGLPIGVQLVAATGREDLLLRVAAQLEAARPWRDRRPRVHA